MMSQGANFQCYLLANWIDSENPTENGEEKTKEQWYNDFLSGANKMQCVYDGSEHINSSAAQMVVDIFA